MLKEDGDGSIVFVILINQTLDDIPAKFLPTFDYKIIELVVDIDTDIEPEFTIKDGRKK
ncbi:hypothetical protein M2140_000402 [Clostridiales Family XIII bacterium PM5-7]